MKRSVCLAIPFWKGPRECECSQRKDVRLIPKNRMFIGHHIRCRQGREGYRVSSWREAKRHRAERNRRRCLSSRSRCPSAQSVENRCMPQRRSWPGVTSGTQGASSVPCATRSQQFPSWERERREKRERNTSTWCQQTFNRCAPTKILQLVIISLLEHFWCKIFRLLR